MHLLDAGEQPAGRAVRRLHQVPHLGEADRFGARRVMYGTFAGMLDPKDPSHCTIDYDLGGQRGVIDVYLTDDDFLRILPRSGRVTGGKWEVGAASAAGESVERPATQPAL